MLLLLLLLCALYKILKNASPNIAHTHKMDLMSDGKRSEHKFSCETKKRALSIQQQQQHQQQQHIRVESQLFSLFLVGVVVAYMQFLPLHFCNRFFYLMHIAVHVKVCL